jgi:hypothetical protein
LDVDGVKYHRVDTDDIPNEFASVPVKTDDNGTEYHTKMLAGAIGIQATSSGDSSPGEEEDAREDKKLGSLQSLSGWFMFEIDKDTKPETNPWDDL